MTHKNKITFFSRPYEYWYDLSQRYYAEGLRCHMLNSGGEYRTVSMSRFPQFLKMLAAARNSYRFSKVAGNSKIPYRVIDYIARQIEGKPSSPSPYFSLYVGQYLFETEDGKTLKICVDIADSGNITSPELLDWCDIYFKTNFWKDRDYPPKTYPMFNANPYIVDNIQKLRSLRSTEKKYDLCFIVRVWGGTNEVEGIEHNIRLIEAAAKIDCKKFLYAYLVAGDIKSYAKRLDAAGIEWSTKPMPIGRLWEISAQARLAVIRLGMHYCVPWRMVDTLAMGGCPVLDRAPLTVWPEPLREKDNFLSLAIDCSPRTPAASLEQYSSIPAKIETWLSDGGKIKDISRKNSDYFDRSLAPEKIGEYIIRKAGEKISYL